MGDNWDDEISGGGGGTSTNNQTTEDSNNNTIKSESKFGGFGARDNNNNNFNKGFRSNERNNNQSGDRQNGFGADRRVGFGQRNNDENGGERRGGYSGGGNRFPPRNNDENGGGERRGGFGNRNNEEGGERKPFGGGGGGDRRGGGFGQRNNDENGGGERRVFGQRNNEDGGERKPFRGGGGGGDRRGGGFGQRNNDENGGGGERRGFGQRNNEDDGERRHFGGGGDRRPGAFGQRNNDENNGGERRGFGQRNNNDQNGEGERRGGFGHRNNDENGGGERRGGGFGQRNNDENNGGERRAFRPRNNEGDGGERKQFGGDRRGGNDERKGDDDEVKRENYIPPPLDENEDALFQTIATGVNFSKQSEIPVNVSGENTNSIKPIERFSDASLSSLLLINISKSKYEVPTPVQKYSIPIILARRDLMACAQTGSGKTAAYVLPIMTNILEDGIQSSELMPLQMPQALILSPTRELAIQIFRECRKFSLNSMIKSQILYGGVNTGHQMHEVNKGCNILVATPGRLLDVLNKGQISLEKIKYFVLDEADRMLDLGFEKPVRDILAKCTLDKSERNIFMFSATFPKEIQQLAQDFLSNYLFLTVGIIGGANSDVSQTIHKATRFEKRDKLLEILNDIGDERTMVFIEHKKQADVLAFFLSQKGYPTTSIHGDRLQSQRELALTEFKNGKSKIIVCTSVAARGLDISDVNHVINYDLPQTIDEYVHRIGRTGRCGNIGKAISFFDTECDNDRKLARNLCRIIIQANKEVPDWLNSIAEDCVGSTFSGKDCTDDLRDDFKSLAVSSGNTNDNNDEAWD